jgi:hypothetical protein
MNSWSKDANSTRIPRARTVSRKRAPLAGGVFALLTVVATLAGAPAALALTNFSWNGVNPAQTSNPTSFGWSQPLNWSGDTSPSGSIGQLSFPDLGGTCDTTTNPADACYVSLDDAGAVTATGLSIDDYWPYEVSPAAAGDTITLNDSGTTINAASSDGIGSGYAPDISVPVIVGQDQGWNINGENSNDDPGNGLEVDTVSGDNVLNIFLVNGGVFYTTTVDTASVSFNGYGSAVAEQLADGTNVSLPEVTVAEGATLYVESPDATSGEIATINGSGLFVGGYGSPDTTLAVDGSAEFNAAALGIDIDGDGSAAGTDFSQLAATGNIDFSNATLFLVQGTDDSSGDCATLTPGSSLPIITSSGTITGDLSYYDASDTLQTLAPGQTSTATTPVDTSEWCPNTTEADATLTYGAHAITATIAAAPNGGEAGGGGSGTTSTSAPKLFGSAPVIGGTAIVGQTLTVTNNGSFSGTPTPTYTYRWLVCGSACTPITGATGQTYKILSTQVGEKIEVEVSANNSAGSANATSNEIGPVLAVPSVVNNNGATSTGNGPNPKTVEAAISKLLTPTGRLAKIPGLLKDGGYTFTFKAPSGGKLTLSWTATVKRKKVNVASESVSLKRKGTDKIKLKLSAAGRSLLEHSSRLTLHVTATFTPSGHSKVGSTTNIRLS